MALMHSCKTKTHEEVRLSDEMERIHIQKVKQAVQHVQVEDAYQKLLQDTSYVRMQIPDHDVILPLKRNMFGLYMIPVSMYERTYWFILDTGAQISGIRTHVLEHLPIQKLKGTLPVGSAGGKNKEMNGYMLDCMEIQALKIYHLPVIGLEKEEFAMRFGNLDLFNFDGILGWDILSKLDFEIDDVAKEFKIMKNRFRFSYENALPAAFPILFVKDEQNHIVTMGIDTGAKVSWMNEGQAKQMGYAMSDSYQMLGFGVHGMEPMDVKIVEQCDFYLYRAHVRLKNVYTGRTNIFPNLTIDGILGNEVFRNRRIRFVNSKHMVLLA